MVFCSECNNKLGLLSLKYKRGDGAILCITCYDNEKKHLKENNKKIMREYVEKYLSTKDTELSGVFLAFYNDKDIKLLFQKDSLQKLTERLNTRLTELEHSNKSRMSSDEIDEMISDKKIWTQFLDFLYDLEKMYRLFKKKDINTDYLEIFSVFAEVSKQNIDQEYDKLLTPFYKRIYKKIDNTSTAENIIKEYLKIPDAVPDYEVTSRLLNKFNINYDKGKTEKIINKILGDIELEEFEEDFGSTKIDIGDFEELTGYEFEGYLKNLFTLLGYTVIQTSLSGDQGADLIISKDGEKSVVQTKKYAGNVSNGAVQEIVAAKNHYKAQKAIVVTNSSFTKSAIDLALSNEVELWDGSKLKNVIRNLKNKKKKSALNKEAKN